MMRFSLRWVFLLIVFFHATQARAWVRTCISKPGADPVEGCPSNQIGLKWFHPCMEYAIDSAGGKDITADELATAVDHGFDAWEAADCSPGVPAIDGRQAEEFVMCNSASFDEDGPNINAVGFVSNWAERNKEDAGLFDPDAIAVTITWYDRNDGEVLDADILINDTPGRFEFAICPDIGGCVIPPVPVDLQSIVTHEIGHFYGMGHSPINGTTMFASYNAMNDGNSLRTLASDDIDGICTIYPPGSEDPGLCTDDDYEPIGGTANNCLILRVKNKCSMAPAESTNAADVALVALLALSLISLFLTRNRRSLRAQDFE